MMQMSAHCLRERLTRPWRHGEHADLRGVSCEGRLNLRSCDVAGFDLSGASFPEGIDARGARFHGLSWFGNAKFQGSADFTGAAFMNDARFEGAHFASEATFEGAEFRGIGRFDGCTFSKDAHFLDLVSYGNFSIQQVRMEGAANFRGSEWLGGLWCQAAALPLDVELNDTQVHGRLWLRGAHRGNLALGADDFGMSFGYTYL